MKSIAYTLWIAAALLGQRQEFPRDPVKDMQKRAEKESSEKNYKELREAATELAEQANSSAPKSTRVDNTSFQPEFSTGLTESRSWQNGFEIRRRETPYWRQKIISVRL